MQHQCWSVRPGRGRRGGGLHPASVAHPEVSPIFFPVEMGVFLARVQAVWTDDLCCTDGKTNRGVVMCDSGLYNYN